MTLRDTIARHAPTTLTNPDHLGESVLYRFKAGGTRTVRAVVRRLDKEPITPNAPQAVVRRAIVSIPKDATVGITAVDVKGDSVDVALRLGDDVETVRVRRIVRQNPGLFVLEVSQ